MIKLLIGGSPCTYWSIAQKNNRETQAEGMGWELFKNYLLAKEKFKPDFFLYENNKSASQAIKDQISRELGVDLMYINSALVSAQNRQRFYAFNWEVEQPEDRGVYLKDILETGLDLTRNNKSFCLTANYNGAVAWNMIERSQRNMVAVPVIFQKPHGFNNGGMKYDKSSTLTANGKWQDNNLCVEPIRVGAMPQLNGLLKDNQATRIYGVDGKSVTQSANGGGWGAKTGLYAIPVENPESYLSEKMVGYAYKEGTKNFKTRVKILEDKACPLTTEQNKRAGTTNYIPQNLETIDYEITTDGTAKNAKPIYEVKDGLITINGKQYPIKLANGYYIIRNLTVKECCRLQTLPDDYCRAVSNAQAYKGLGNGWTAEVIIHILNGALASVPKDEEIVVLSMYDGIGTGRYSLDKMGFTNVKYFAYEIDKYAMQIALNNYPDIIELGDAFQLRQDDWCLQKSD